METIDLIEACSHKDSTAQKYFYDTYSSKIMGVCLRYAAGGKDSETMALYVFKKLFAELKTCPREVNMDEWISDRAIWNAIAYLHEDKHRYFIAKTTRYMENKANATHETDESDLSIEDSRKIYLAALHALTPSYRILYNLTYVDKVIPDKIIQNLEIARDTYKVELEQARFQYKQHLNTYLHENGLRKQ